jgi:hypothetical protein
MDPVPQVPRQGAIYLDARGDGRALRLTWHDERDLVVLSLWRDNVCVGTFRLTIDEVPDLVDALRGGLARAYDRARDRVEAADGRRTTLPGAS